MPLYKGLREKKIRTHRPPPPPPEEGESFEKLPWIVESYHEVR